jgi:predicted ATPase
MVVALRIDIKNDDHYNDIAKFVEDLGFKEKAMALAAAQACRNIILTGPPGAGKTTMTKRFKGIARIVDEVAREVIQERDARGKWGKGSLQPEIYKRTKARVEKALGSDDDFILFDRTHIDCLAYGYTPEEPPRPIKDAEVWVLKHHPEWYQKDPARRETAAEAEKIGKRLKKVYEDLGYSVREIDAADPSTWPKWARKRLQRKMARGTNNRGRIEELDFNRPTTHYFVSDIIKGITEDMQAVVENRKLMAKKKKPLNKQRRLKELERAKSKKERGQMPPPTKKHKDKRREDRQQSRSKLKKEYVGMDVVRELSKIARLLVGLSAMRQVQKEFLSELPKWTKKDPIEVYIEIDYDVDEGVAYLDVVKAPPHIKLVYKWNELQRKMRIDDQQLLLAALNGLKDEAVLTFDMKLKDATGILQFPIKLYADFTVQADRRGVLIRLRPDYDEEEIADEYHRQPYVSRK